MNTWLCNALLLALAADPQVAVPAEEPPAGERLALRIWRRVAFTAGFSLDVPAGRVTRRGERLADAMGTVLALDVGIAFALRPELQLIADLQLGEGDYGDPDCYALKTDVICGTHTRRAAIGARYNFSPEADRSIWLSLGTGYEETTVGKAFPPNPSPSGKYLGWELVRAGIGVDFTTTSDRRLGFGVEAKGSVGRYFQIDDHRHDGVFTSGTIDPDDRALHYLFSLGARLVL